MITPFYNYETILLFAGGLFAWFLSATVASIKHIKRKKTVDPAQKGESEYSANRIPNIRKMFVDTGDNPC